MCLGDWKAHGSEYYECSRYKENPNIANESVHAQAREALKKYLFYFERVCGVQKGGNIYSMDVKMKGGKQHLLSVLSPLAITLARIS